MSGSDSLHRTIESRRFELPADAQFWHVNFKPQFLEISPDKQAHLQVSGAQDIGLDYLTFTVDIYLKDNEVHPHGHLGWWKFDLPRKRAAELSFSIDSGRLSVTSKREKLLESWVNEQFKDVESGSSLLIHLVLRHSVNNAIVSLQSLVGYRNHEEKANDTALALSFVGAAQRKNLTYEMGFNWPPKRTVHLVTQYLPNAGIIAGMPTAPMLMRMLRQAGIPAQLYASSFNPALRGEVVHTRELKSSLGKDDVLLLIYDNHEPHLDWLAELACSKAFVNLGLPSATRMQAFDAESYRNLTLAKENLCASKAFDVVAAASTASADELREAIQEDTDEMSKLMVGSLFDRQSLWDRIALHKIKSIGSPSFLFPASLTPDHDFVGALELFKKVSEMNPAARLVVPCQFAEPTYLTYVRHLMETTLKSIADRVVIFPNVSDSDLKGWMSTCDAMLYTGRMSMKFDQWLRDADIFFKPLFVDGNQLQWKGSVQARMFRLYGDAQDKAEAIVSVLERGLPERAGQITAPDRSMLWQVLEELVALEKSHI